MRSEKPRLRTVNLVPMHYFPLTNELRYVHVVLHIVSIYFVTSAYSAPVVRRTRVQRGYYFKKERIHFLRVIVSRGVPPRHSIRQVRCYTAHTTREKMTVGHHKATSDCFSSPPSRFCVFTKGGWTWDHAARKQVLGNIYCIYSQADM